MNEKWLVPAALAAATIAAIGTGCAQAAVTSTTQGETPMMPAAASRMPTVQAGAVFDAHLDNALDTRLTRPGSRFTATVAQDLVDDSGAVLVPAGALIRGTVASTGSLQAPHLELNFQQIATRAGVAPIAVKVLSADTERYMAWTEPPGYTAAQSMMQSMPQSYEQQITYSYQPPGTMPILMRSGATLRLELIRPIIVNTTSSTSTTTTGPAQ